MTDEKIEEQKEEINFLILIYIYMIRKINIVFQYVQDIFQNPGLCDKLYKKK